MVKTILIPYHTGTMDLHIEEKNLKAVLNAKVHEFKPDGSEPEIVRRALANPIGSKRLSELAIGKKRVTLITSDHTRAVPSKITLPILLEEIRTGSPEADITILIATGLHRAPTAEEMRAMFGDAVVDNERIVVHDAFKDEDMVDICTLPSGAGLVVNRLAVECDLLVTEGFIEPHFFAGFSGGRKSILPGICSAVTVNENHSYTAIAHPNSVAGITTGNPIHDDMVFAVRKVIVHFTLNVGLDADKKIIAAFAGEIIDSHQQGCDFIAGLSRCPAVPGDVVVTSNGGYPLDQNLYQSAKAVATAEACAGEDGVIVMVCSCVDGMGGTHFERLIAMGTPEEIDAYLSSIPSKETISEQWCAQIYARILKKHKVILVTASLAPEVVRKANMIPAASPDEAMGLAYAMKGKDAQVVVIPDGVAVLTIKE